MFHSKKVKKEVFDQELLDAIFHTKKQWSCLEEIMYRSIEPSEEGRCELAIARAKYIYLLKEAKVRHLSAIK